MSDGWSGPESLHYTRRREQLSAWREAENNENVLRWLDQREASLTERINRACIAEEREPW